MLTVNGAGHSRSVCLVRLHLQYVAVKADGKTLSGWHASDTVICAPIFSYPLVLLKVHENLRLYSPSKHDDRQQ